MTSPQLPQVIAHLRGLAARTLAAAELPHGEFVLRAREVLEDYVRVDPCVTAIEANVTPLVVNERPCEWLVAEGGDAGTRMLYIHGGSWFKGSLNSHRSLVARIARASGASVLSLDYRLAPEHPFPAGLQDCCAAFLWMLEHGPSGPDLARHSFIAGDSAGGNLALAAMLSLKGENKPLPDGAIVMSPATDFTNSGDSITTKAEVDPLLTPETLPNCAAIYLQHGENLRRPLVSPLFGELSGLPPLLIQVGDAEILLDDSRRFAKAARKAGVVVDLDVWPEMPHVFQAFAPYLPEALEAIEGIGKFVRSIAFPE